MIAGIGVDLVDIAQMREHVADPIFLEYTFTQYEREYASTRGDAGECLSGMYAAKEAVTKALAPLACGDGFDIREVEILHAENGTPYVAQSTPVAAFMREHGIEKMHISISHDGGYATAFAVAEG